MGKLKIMKWCSPLLIWLLVSSATGYAVTLKVAVLAPEGTNWANNLKKMAKDVKKATDGKVKFKIYFGGVAGDEPDVLRKVRVGQLHGGVFTGRTLGDVYGDVRVIELPFNFKGDRDTAWKAMNAFKADFNQGFEKNGFRNLGFFEIGDVYVVSTKKFSSLDDLKGIKVWSWEGDKLASSMVEALGLVSIPLALPDVLSSLSTGIVEAAYSPPMAIIALQWQNKIKYLLDYPVTFSMGAFLLTEKAWGKVPKEHQAKVMEITQSYVDKANKKTAVENKEALQTLKKMGIQFLEVSKADRAKEGEIRKNVISKVKGSLISDKTLKKFSDNFKKL